MGFNSSLSHVSVRYNNQLVYNGDDWVKQVFINMVKYNFLSVC